MPPPIGASEEDLHRGLRTGGHGFEREALRWIAQTGA